ncbi:MAG: PLP-dependent aminotransferase family protein [Leifsonia sp.]
MDGAAFGIDRASAIPLARQLVDQVRRRILAGDLRPGDRLPSTRELAGAIGVSRGVVVEAWEQLTGEGYLAVTPGAAPRVAELVAGKAPQDAPHGLEPPVEARPPRIDLLPGHPSTARLDVRAWRAAWRHAAAIPLPSAGSPPFGESDLRMQIAEHVRHARGLVCAADDVIVTAGTSDALALLTTALRELHGPRPRLAVEEPGYPSARAVAERSGARIVPVAVEADGISVPALRALRPRPDAVLLTPSHQYPLGGRLPIAGRLELVAWARERGVFIIEDDYDSEFRHRGAPLPALSSLDENGEVALVGSFSKVLSPALRAGYIVLPRRSGLRDRLEAALTDSANSVSSVTQHALAHLLASGAVRRHIAAARRDYAHRRTLVVDALDGIDGVRLTGIDSGLHAVVELGSSAAVAHVVARLARSGVAVAVLADYYADRAGARPGLVVGYAAPGDLALAEGLALLREAILASGGSAGE